MQGALNFLIEEVVDSRPIGIIAPKCRSNIALSSLQLWIGDVNSTNKKGTSVVEIVLKLARLVCVA